MKPLRLITAALCLILCRQALAQDQGMDATLSTLADNVAAQIKEHGNKKITVLDFTDLQGGQSELGRYIPAAGKGVGNGILVWDIDRLYRNPVDEGRVRWMLQRGIIAAIRTPTRSYFPADAGLLIAVEGGRATDFIIHHKRDVARGIEEKLLRGEWPGQKPFGYIYDHDLRNIVPHPKHSKIVQAVFKEAVTGRYGLTALGARLAQFGVLTKKQKKPWSNSQVYFLLTNKLYCGIMEWNGGTFEGKYKPVISHELFNQVQAALKDRSKPRLTKKKHNFPFCGLFRCTCGAMISAQWAKGHGGLYRYYRCSRKMGKCAEPYTQEKSVVEQCLDLLKPLAISPEEADLTRALIDEEIARDSGAVEAGVAKVADRLDAVQAKLNKLARAYLDGRIDEESHKAMSDDLIVEKTSLKQEKKRLERDGFSYWNEPAKEVISALEMAGKMQIEKSPQEISLLVNKTGTNRLLSGKTVSFSFSEPYDFTASLLASDGIPTSTTSSPLCGAHHESSKWCAIKGSNL